MPDRQVSIRIGVTGQQDAQRAFQTVGKAAQEAFAQATGAVNAAGAATDQQTARLQRLAAAARQAASSDQAQRNFNVFMGIGGSGAGSAKDSAAVFEQAARAQEDLAQRSAALRAQIDPLGAAQTKMNSAIADATQLLEVGTITEGEHTAAVALARSRYAEAEAALTKYGEAGAFANARTMALAAAFRHIADASIAGVSPMRALAMETGNLSFALGGGGLDGALKGVGGMLAGLLSPTVLLTGGIAALAAGVVYAYASFESGQEALAASLEGVGRAAGATVDQMNAIAKAAGDSGKVSVAAARTMEEAFAQTGAIGADEFAGLIDATQRYARAFDVSSADATKAIARAFADPATGAEQLNQKLGFLDDKTLQYIQTLEAEGDREQAQKALLDALNPSIDAATHKVGLLAEAWRAVSDASSEAVDAVGHAISKAVNGPSLADQLEQLQQERKLLTGSGPQFVPNALGVPTLAPPGSPEIAAAGAKLDQQIAAVQAKIDAANVKAIQLQAQTAARAESLQVAGLVDRLVPEVKQYQDLVDEQARLQKDLGNPIFRDHVADLDKTQQAYDAVTHAVETYLTPAQKSAELAQLDLKALTAITPAQKAEIAAERERIELAGKAIPADQAAAKIAQARTQASSEATHVLTQESIALDQNARSSLAVADAWLKSGAAGEVAEARAKAMSAALTSGVDVQTRTTQLVQQAAAQEAASGAKQVADMAARTAAQKRLNDAVAAGQITTTQAREELRAEGALQPLITAQTVAEGAAKTELTRVIEALRGAYANLNQERARSNAEGVLEGQKNQSAMLAEQIRLVGASTQEQEAQVAVLREKQRLVQQSIDPLSAEGQVILGNTAHIEAQKTQLATEQQTVSDLGDAFDSAFGHFSDLISEGKLDWSDWAGAARSAISDIDSELLKMAVINPIENALFGGTRSTLASAGGILGNLAGGLFGGGGAGTIVDAAGNLTADLYHAGGMAGAAAARRAIPAGFFADAPRFASGGFLSPGEVPAILHRGERVLNPRETQAYDRRAGTPVVNVTIQTPSPVAFKASQTQISAQIARAVQRGRRIM